MTETREVKKIATMVHVTPQVLEDSAFDVNGWIAQRLSAQLNQFAVQNALTILMDSFVIEKVDGGFWVEPEPPTRRERLAARLHLRKLREPYFVKTVAFRAEAKAY